MKIGFIGLGAMGKPMAKNLIKKGGYSLIVNDLNKEAVKDLVSVGAEAAESANELVIKSDVIITMLPNSPQMEQVSSEFMEHLDETKIYIDMSTIDPSTTRKVYKKVIATGAKMIDAPVGRTTDHAKEGTISIMVGGEKEVVNQCKPILSAMGTDIIYCGGIGNGETMKVINNLLTGIIVTANAEVLTLGLKAGLSLETMLDVLRGTAANNGHLNITFPAKALKGDFTPGFATRLAHKDMNLAINLANDVNFPLSIGSASTQVFGMARAMGFDDEDYTSVIKVLENFTDIEVRE